MAGRKLTPVMRRVAAIAVLVMTPVAATAENLADAMIAAYQNSGLLEQNRALLRAADEGVAQAVAAVRPTISYFANSTHTDPANQRGDNLSGNAGLTAQLTLIDFGRNQLAIDAAKETVLATREALVGIEQQVLLNAVQAYMSVRRESEFVSLRQSNVRLITQELRAARDRFEVGEVTRTDVSIAESRLASSRASLAAAEGNLAQARELYRAAVGHYPTNLAPAPAIPQTASSLEAVQSTARLNHPDVKQAQREVTVAELNIARAEANRRPSVSLSGQAALDNYGDDSSSVGVEISGLIYQGGQLRSLKRQAAARRDASRAGLLLASQQVIQNAGNAWSNLQVALVSSQATDRQIEAARMAYEGTREEAQLGARTTLDVLNAEQELLDARANRVSAGADAQIAAYNVLAAMGYLTVRNLGLNIATYDPADYYNAVENAPLTEPSAQGKRLDALLERLGRN